MAAAASAKEVVDPREERRAKELFDEAMAELAASAQMSPRGRDARDGGADDVFEPRRSALLREHQREYEKTPRDSHTRYARPPWQSCHYMYCAKQILCTHDVRVICRLPEQAFDAEHC